MKTKCVRGIACLCAWALPLIGAESNGVSLPVHPVQTQSMQSWQLFHAKQSKCRISLPGHPEHIQQLMPMPEGERDLRYDVYVAAHNREAVYMVLVAEYPSFVEKRHANKSLESFLNGILAQNPKNKLIFADLVEIDGHVALDFHIQTVNNYFKGRAIMADSNLYLLAMECDMRNYKEDHFSHFINSFEIVTE